MPSSCKRIEANAFRDNTSLQEVVFSEGLEYIGADAFRGCINLEKIELPDTVTEIKDRAFLNCKKIKSFTMPSSVENLEGNDFFAGCTSLMNIELGNIKSLGFHCFNGVPADKLIIPKSCIKISSQAFTNSNIKQIIVEDGNEKYKVENGFLVDGSGICYYVNQSLVSSTSTLKISEGVKCFSINFARFSNIKKVVIPQTLTTFSVACYLPSSISEIEVTTGNATFSVNDNALYSGTTLMCCYSKSTSYTPKDGTTEIYQYAFCSAPNITEIFFPDSIIYIGYDLFTNSSKITRIKLGKNVQKIDSGMLNYGFNGTIEIDSGNPYYIYDNGSLYNKDKTTLCAVFNKSISTYTLDENVLNIGNYAFYDCKKLSNITMNKKIKSIGQGVFKGCIALEKIELPSSIEKIDRNGFSPQDGALALRQVTIHKKKGDVENWSSNAWGLPVGERGVIWDE